MKNVLYLFLLIIPFIGLGQDFLKVNYDSLSLEREEELDSRGDIILSEEGSYLVNILYLKPLGPFSGISYKTYPTGELMYEGYYDYGKEMSSFSRCWNINGDSTDCFFMSEIGIDNYTIAPMSMINFNPVFEDSFDDYPAAAKTLAMINDTLFNGVAYEDFEKSKNTNNIKIEYFYIEGCLVGWKEYYKNGNLKEDFWLRYCYNYDVNKLLLEIGKEKLIDLIEDYSVDRWDEYGERMSK